MSSGYTAIPSKPKYFSSALQEQVRCDSLRLIRKHGWWVDSESQTPEGHLIFGQCGFKRISIWIGQTICHQSVDIELCPGRHSLRDLVTFLSWGNFPDVLNREAKVSPKGR